MSYLVIHLEIFLDHKPESPIFVSYSSPIRYIHSSHQFAITYFYM